MPSPTPDRVEVTARFPASTAQRQLWFMDQMAPGDPSLNVAVRWEVRGRVQAQSLERAFQMITDRHEILRTRFAEEDGMPVQEVVNAAEFRLGVVDLRTTPEAQHAARLDEIATEDAARPFDLTHPGLLRATLVRLSAERAVLLIVAHHTVFDGFSIRVLGHEVGTIAEALEAGRAPDLPELPLQYGDYALWQQEYLASGIEAEDAAYWARQMKGAPYFELEPDKTRPPLRSNAVARSRRALPPDFIARMETVAKAQAVSTFTLGAAVVTACLHRATGAAEVLVSTPIAGRIDTDLEPLIGPFLSHQVLRVPTADETAFTGHLATTRRLVEEALAHQALPFARLIEIVNPPRDPSRAPLTGVAFSLQYVFLKDHRYGDFELISVPSHTPGSAQDLNIVLIGRPSGWALNAEYCPDLYESGTIESLLDTMLAGFEAVLAKPETALGALPLDGRLALRASGDARMLKPVEETLAAHPEVGAVAAVPSGAGSYAFVSPRPETPVPLETLPAELMGFAARRLPADLMPQGISVLAALPRTAEGDIDRARLPRPLQAVPAAPAPVSAPPSAPKAAPHDAGGIEDRLAALWADLLVQPAPPRDVSFFDLGGHSLMAVRMMARIRDVWGLPMGVAAIYAAPTIRALSARIAADLGATRDDTANDWRIEPLIPEGDAQPIIAVNDVGILLSTASQMQGRHKATCVRLFDGIRGIDQRPRTFEEIAAEYAAVIRKVQPHGPYLVFGVCVHGNIALEAARLLQAEGEEIAGIVIKDVWEPGYVARIKADSGIRWRERLYALRNKVRMVRSGSMTLSAMLGSYRLIRRTGILQLATRLGLIDRVKATDLTPEQERFVSYISAARNCYRPAPLNAPVLHIVTRITPHGGPFARSIGWEDVVTGRLKTVNIDEVLVKGGQQLGTAELAQEIDTFLAEGAAAPATAQ